MKKIFPFAVFVLTIASYGQVDSSIYAPVSNIVEMGWMVDKGPEPIGGLDSLINWLDNNNTLMNKSDTMTRKQFVAVQFWVDTTGSLIDIGIIRGMGRPYDQEAYRLISECPIRWSPGELRKKRISMRFTIPVYFTKKKY
jgi:protein TonB